MTWRNAEKLDKLDMLIGLALENFKDDDAEKYIGADLSDVTFSDSYHRRKKRVINRYLAKQVFASARKVAARVAIVVLCLISAAFITVMSVSALRNSLWKAIIEWYDDYISIRFEEPIYNTEDNHKPSDNVVVSPPTEILQYCKPLYIPEGVEEEVVLRSVTSYIVDYYSSDDLCFSYNQSLLNGSEKNFNNEDGIIYSLKIKNYNATVVENSANDNLMIIWEDGVYFYFLLSYLDIDETIKIAESVAPETDEKDSGVASGVPTKILEYRKPTYLPKGFEEEIVHQGVVANIIDYYLGDELQLSYKQSVLGDEDIWVNNEDSVVEKTTVNEFNAYIVKSDINEELMLIWSDGEYIYNIISYVEYDETIKIAESITPETDEKDSGVASGVPTKILEYRKPTYLPKGFEEQEMVKSKGAYCIDYYQNGIWVCAYRQRVLNEDEKKINNENSIVYQVDIKGNEATVIENKDDKHLDVMWEDGRYIYSFSSYTSLEETIKMAESIETVTENTDNNSTAPVETIKNIS